MNERRLRAENLRASEAIARLATIVESSDDAIIGKTLEGVITSWNKGAEKLYGYSAAEVVGQPISILVPPDRFAGGGRRSLPGSSRVSALRTYESVRVRKDRTLVDVSLSMFPLTDSRGEVTGAASIARDITERKRAEDRECTLGSHREVPRMMPFSVSPAKGSSSPGMPARSGCMVTAAEEIKGKPIDVLDP